MQRTRLAQRLKFQSGVLEKEGAKSSYTYTRHPFLRGSNGIPSYTGITFSYAHLYFILSYSAYSRGDLLPKMLPFSPYLCTLALVLFLTIVSPTPRALTGYNPVRATCPTTPLTRPANGISSSEQSYINSRYTKAPAALTAFLKGTDTTFSSSKLPVVALTTSSGEYRSLLTGAGVLQGLDGRDSKTGVSGLFQGLTYETGLSGGTWYMFNPSTASPREYSTRCCTNRRTQAPFVLRYKQLSYNQFVAS
jgi:hypothetical protein